MMRAMCSVRTRCHWARRLGTSGAARKRQQGDVARALDSHTQTALVPGANAGHAARQNLAALLHELRKNVRALVVDEVDLLHAELANFLFAEILALAAGTAARSAWTTRSTFASPPRTAFTPWSSTASTTRRWCLFLFLWHTYHPSEFLVVSSKS